MQSNIIDIINENGTFVVKYLCSAYGKMCDLEASTIWIINPFRYKGYYYDEETKLYYLTSRYYDPEVGRFITPDSINCLDSKSITGLNLYAYCVNDPVNRLDPSGHDWKSFWNKIGNFIKSTFGVYIDLSKTIIKEGKDFLLFGWEKGIKTGETIGDNNKTFSIFATNANKWYRFWEYQIGFKINIGNFNYTSSFGIGEANISLSLGLSTLELQCGINKISVGSSYTNNDITYYNQYYIRTIPMALAIVGLIYAPGIVLPMIGKVLRFAF